MTLVFVSNYYNHHQASFSEEMNRLLDGNYYFVAMEKVEDERANMGWCTDGFPEFVHQYEAEIERCDDLIDNADVVIKGSAPVTIIKQRLKKKKLTFIYSERLDKETPNLLSRMKSIVATNYYFRGIDNLYCLCASAFTSYDFKERFLFINKCYKWGYFPEVRKYDNVQKMIDCKNGEQVSILFVSRLINWKHPELPLLVARKLKEDDIRFHLTIIGIGEMEDELHSMIQKYGLETEITHIRSMSPKEVRTYMDNSAVFLLTSDRNEGWGAVLNESMNSACAVVASSAIGSVPFLIRDGKNGYIYQDGVFEDLYYKVKDLCKNQQKRLQFGLEAYKTITTLWNAEEATQRLLNLIDDLKNSGISERFTDGPCSRAEIIHDNWYN